MELFNARFSLLFEGLRKHNPQIPKAKVYAKKSIFPLLLAVITRVAYSN